jgi:hypothetical protein
MEPKLEKTLAFWKFESKSGKKGLKTTAKMDVNIPNGSKILIMANDFKRNEKDPDYYLFVSKDQQMPQQQLIQTPQDDDLPF